MRLLWRAWYIGSLLLVWSLAEAYVSRDLKGSYSASLIVAAWGVTWFASNAVFIKHTLTPSSRRKLYAISALAAVTSLITLHYASHKVVGALAAYLLSTSSLAIATTASVASILRGSIVHDLGAHIARLRIYPGLTHALMALLFKLIDPAFSLPVLVLLVAVPSAIMILSEKPPIIPAVTIEVFDRFTSLLLKGEYINNGSPRIPFSLIALIISALSVAKLLYLPRAMGEVGVYHALVVYATALVMGAFVGAYYRSPIAMLILMGAAAGSTIISLHPLATLFFMVASLAYIEVYAFISTALITPTRIPLLSWRIGLSMMVISIIYLLVVVLCGGCSIIF